MNNDDLMPLAAWTVLIFFVGFMMGGSLFSPKPPTKESTSLVNVVKTNDYLGNTYYIAIPK